MYVVTGADRPQEIRNLPQSDIGAPCPVVVAREHKIYLAYYLQHAPEGWNGNDINIDTSTDASEQCALVIFNRPYAHMFGPPNDEALPGHPLASRGLEPYGVFEIVNSSWLKGLETMNSCHRHHKPALFSKFRHFVFTFHDTTFECIAESFELTRHRDDVWDTLLKAQ